MKMQKKKKPKLASGIFVKLNFKAPENSNNEAPNPMTAFEIDNFKEVNKIKLNPKL